MSHSTCQVRTMQGAVSVYISFSHVKDNSSVDPMEVDSTAHVDSGAMRGSCEYEVVAFIKQKIIFKDRPKPIVQKSSLRT